MSYQNDQTIPVYASWIGSWQISLRRRPLSIAELTKHYDRRAHKWHSLTQWLGLENTYTRLFTQFIEQADFTEISKPVRVLDCGVGTGTLSLAFARTWAGPASMHAVDVSEAMLNQARRRLQQARLNPKFERADVCQLPYADNTFDLVMAAHVLEHLPDPKVAIAEMKRVLKPGGWLMLCITRQSVLGRYIQLKWRTHSVTNEQLESLLNTVSLDTHCVHLTPSGFFQFTSVAGVGRKANTALN